MPAWVWDHPARLKHNMNRPRENHTVDTTNRLNMGPPTQGNHNVTQPRQATPLTQRNKQNPRSIHETHPHEFVQVGRLFLKLNTAKKSESNRKQPTSQPTNHTSSSATTTTPTQTNRHIHRASSSFPPLGSPRNYSSWYEILRISPSRWRAEDSAFSSCRISTCVAGGCQ
jgi:hypothetical protein